MIKVLLAIPTICDCFPPTINEINIGGIYPLAEASCVQCIHQTPRSHSSSMLVPGCVYTKSQNIRKSKH